MKVLVVDDSCTMRRIITNCRDDAGYREVVHASDGMEALDVLSKDVPVIMVTTQSEKQASYNGGVGQVVVDKQGVIQAAAENQNPVNT